MSITTASQFALSRTRKDMDSAFKDQNWDAIKHTDKQLTDNLNAAFDDDDRDIKSLIDELEKIVILYGNMVASLPSSAQECISTRSD